MIKGDLKTLQQQRAADKFAREESLKQPDDTQPESYSRDRARELENELRDAAMGDNRFEAKRPATPPATYLSRQQFDAIVALIKNHEHPIVPSFPGETFVSSDSVRAARKVLVGPEDSKGGRQG